MTFDYVIDAPVIPANQRGTLQIVVENSVVTQSVKTGVFAGVAGIPSVSAPKNFEFRLDGFPFSYTLPASPAPPPPGHSVELSFDGGTHSTGLPSGNMFSDCTVVTDIGNGFDEADISEPPTGDSDLGFTAELNNLHVAIPIVILAGPAVKLDGVLVPIFQVGAPTGISTIQAAYTRLWMGDPMAAGVVIGGDMVTDRLELDVNGDLDVDGDIDVYRVPQSDQTNGDRRIQEAMVALDHLPVLAPGSYYLELAFDGMSSLSAPEMVPCPWPEPDDRGLTFDAITGQWQLARDSQSQRIVGFCNTLFGGDTGACCDPNTGVCTNQVTDLDCDSGRVWTRGAICNQSLCPSGTGACCLSNNGCALGLTHAACTQNGGLYFGPGSTSCPHDPQGNCIPAVSEWGALILSLLLLIGATISIARRRTIAA